MNENGIRRLLGIVEKTGDKVIVTDPAGEHPYVLMSLDQYERLIGSASEKPIEAKVSQETPPEPPKVKPQAPTPKPPSAKPQIPPWRAKLGLDTVEPPVQDLFKGQPRAKVTAVVAEESAMDAEGEEQFYLEPLE